METYNPDHPINSEEWLAIDEERRLALVDEYHEGMFDSAQQRRLHSSIQTTVENQIAMGDETPARATLERLMKEDDLGRHEAIHAVGSVLAGLLHEAITGKQNFSNEVYGKQLAGLTRKSWEAQFEAES